MQTEGLLKQSQQLAGELQTQQRELQQTNEQLEQKAQQLAERNVEVERKNQEIEQARRALEEKAAELALTSKYKSEFLANMSHELRTPLNSILILGQQLADNPDGNLTSKQTEFARTIHGAGTDLLNLISDILDLSKIESGTVTVEAEEIFFSNLLDAVGRPFRHEADTRQLSFKVDLDPSLGRSLITDAKRLQQVLKNLLSNAFKFTDRGGVQLKVSAAPAGGPRHIRSSARRRPSSPSRLPIPASEFRPRNRRSSSRPSSRPTPAPAANTAAPAWGLRSAASCQTCWVAKSSCAARPMSAAHLLFICQSLMPAPRLATRPAERTRHATAASPDRASPERVVEQIPDDRHEIQPGNSILLIVEDDPHYCRVLVDLARDRGFKVLVAMRGADALELAKQYQPSAVSLDVFLPDMLGWSVLSQLKQNPLTRHIPVQIITLDEDKHHGLARGAFSFVSKPTTTEGVEAALRRIKEYSTPRRKRLLVVEDNPAEQMSISELLGYDDVEIETADTGRGALDALRRQPADCVVLDLRLPDMTGFEVLGRVGRRREAIGSSGCRVHRTRA